MQVCGADFFYEITNINDGIGTERCYRYTVYQRSPKYQRLLYGYKDTSEKAREIAEAYTKIAADAWQRHCSAVPERA